MAAKVEKGFLRGDPPTGESLGGLAVVNPDGSNIAGGTGGSSGGLTNTELRAAPVAVTGPLTDAQLRAAAIPVSIAAVLTTDVQDRAARLLGHVTVDNFPATQPVSGTFWQATQPVSGPLTDAQLRAAAVPVSGTFWQATQPVSGTFWQATQPVSLAAAVDVSDRAARAVGAVSAAAGATFPDPPSTLAVTATGAAAAAVTATLPAAGAGLFHYITSIEITLYSTAARTGVAAPVLVTTTNLPGSPVWDFTSAGAIGTRDTFQLTPATPLRSSTANTATTIVAPVVTGGLWRINVTYYTAA